MTTESTKVNDDTKIEITRHENEKIKSKIRYVADQKHGMETWWYENGTKRYKKMWDNGKNHGLRRRWDGDGYIEQETMWRSGKKHGVDRRWYGSGEKEEETYFVRGQEFAQIGWDKEGNVIKTYFPNPVTNPFSKLKKFISRTW